MADLLLGEFDTRSLPESSHASRQSHVTLPVDLNSCLSLNLAYQALIDEVLENIDIRIGEINELHAELVHSLKVRVKSKKDAKPKDAVGTLRIMDDPWSPYTLRCFAYPYFKTDKWEVAEDNTETITRRSQHYPDPYALPARSWRPSSFQVLAEAAVESLRCLGSEPLLCRMTDLREAMDAAGVSEERVKVLKERYVEAEQKLETIKATKGLPDLVKLVNRDPDFLSIAIQHFPNRPSFEVEQYYRALFHNGFYDLDWSLEDDQRLQGAVDANPFDWITISNVVARSPFMCAQRYFQNLEEAPNVSLLSQREIRLVSALANCYFKENLSPYWRQISRFLDRGRRAQFVLRFYYMCLYPFEFEFGEYSRVEDICILFGAIIFGHNYHRVSQIVRSRHQRQCAQRATYLFRILPHPKRNGYTTKVDALRRFLYVAYAATYLQNRSPVEYARSQAFLQPIRNLVVLHENVGLIRTYVERYCKTQDKQALRNKRVELDERIENFFNRAPDFQFTKMNEPFATLFPNLDEKMQTYVDRVLEVPDSNSQLEMSEPPQPSTSDGRGKKRRVLEVPGSSDAPLEEIVPPLFGLNASAQPYLPPNAILARGTQVLLSDVWSLETSSLHDVNWEPHHLYAMFAASPEDCRNCQSLRGPLLCKSCSIRKSCFELQQRFRRMFLMQYLTTFIKIGDPSTLTAEQDTAKKPKSTASGYRRKTVAKKPWISKLWEERRRQKELLDQQQASDIQETEPQASNQSPEAIVEQESDKQE